MIKIRKLLIKINGEYYSKIERSEGNEVKSIELIDLENNDTIYYLD